MLQTAPPMTSAPIAAPRTTSGQARPSRDRWKATRTPPTTAEPMTNTFSPALIPGPTKRSHDPSRPGLGWAMVMNNAPKSASGEVNHPDRGSARVRFVGTATGAGLAPPSGSPPLPLFPPCGIFPCGPGDGVAPISALTVLHAGTFSQEEGPG